MKKFLFILSAGVIVLLSSCSSKKEGSMSDAAKKNIEANDAIVKMFESGDWSRIGDYIDKDAVDHAGPAGDLKGLDSLKAYFASITEKMSNVKNTIIKTLADDEYVMCWMEGSMTAKVDMPEWQLKAGQTHTGNSIEVSKFKDGKVIEHWSFMSAADMMAMMGGGDMSMPPPPQAKDTTKM